MQGRNKGEKGGTMPGHQITAVAEKSQQCASTFLKYSTFAPERPYLRTRGRQTCFLPRARSNRTTTLHLRSACESK